METICLNIYNYVLYEVHVHARTNKKSPDPPPPLKNHKNIGLLSTTGPDPLKNHKASKPASMLGHHPHTSEPPFKWRFAGGPMMALQKIAFGSSTPSSRKNKTTKKNVVKVGPPMTKLSGSAHFSVYTPHPVAEETNHTRSADRGLLEPYHLLTEMSIIRKAYKPPPSSIKGTELVISQSWNYIYS